MSSSHHPDPVGYVDPNFPNPNGPNDASIIIYGYAATNPQALRNSFSNMSPNSYRPSFALVILAAVLFGLAFFAHSYRLYQYRTWYFLPVMLGIAMEVVGYAFRLLSSQKDPYSVIYFVIQYFFIVVAPVFFSAGIYTVLTIFIKSTKREY